MWPIVVVVGHEFADDRYQVVLVEDDQVVQTLAAKGADHSFDDRVRTRRTNRRGDGVDTDAPGALAKVAAEHRIPIAQ